ncbi:MAG TPA: GYF domain-containing protein [Polyangiaceae bacterium]|nr:GYF domain-containing protein [Polyangiaceae bacterium]
MKFIVGFADDRQETHTVAQIVELYSAGKIDEEALVWKDGMADWLSPFDVPELAAAFRAKNLAPRAAGPVPSAIVEDEATLVVRSPLDDPEVQAALAAAGPIGGTTAARFAKPAAVAAEKPAAEPAPQSAAARVERRAGAVDLFSRVSEAGSEGDVALDLGANEDRQKLTGARNESSVLFSLDALTKAEPKATQAQAKAKEREREASEALFGESAPDSLLSLGSGTLGAMAAPDFTKPVSKVAAVPLSDAQAAPDAPSNKGRGGVVLLVGFLAIAAAAAVAFVMMKKQPTTESVAGTPSVASPTLASAEPSSPEAPAASTSPQANAAPATSASTGNAASSASAGSASPAASSSASAAASASAKPLTAAAATAATPAPAAAAKPAEAAAKPAEAAAAEKPAEAPPAAEAVAFDKNAAISALSAAAASAASCKTADGPTGSGKVSVTFAPSGRATATSVAGELAGTEVGGCVARLFRAAKVPPFSGDPVTVSKSFTIQ